MPIDPGAASVILLYALALGVVLFVSPRLDAAEPDRVSFWRSSRFWAALVAILQMAVYALWS